MISAAGLFIVAAVTMLIDHVGCYLWPDCTILRIVGRIAFPIYAMMLAEGFRYTRSRSHYFVRLLITAALSAIPLAAIGAKLNIPFSLNVLFGFCLAFFAMILCEKGLKTAPLVLLAILLAWLIPIDYGFWSVLLPLAFWLIQRSKIAPIWRSALVGITVAAEALSLFWLDGWNVMLWTPIVLPVLWLYGGKKGKLRIPRWLKYGFYPAHLAVIALIVWLI